MCHPLLLTATLPRGARRWWQRSTLAFGDKSLVFCVEDDRRTAVRRTPHLELPLEPIEPGELVLDGKFLNNSWKLASSYHSNTALQVHGDGVVDKLVLGLQVRGQVHNVNVHLLTSNGQVRKQVYK